MVKYVDFGDDDLATTIPESLQEDGVVVITGVFTDDECSAKVGAIADHLTALNPELTRNKKTWSRENLPTGPRYAMFHSLAGNFPAVWDIRTDPRVRSVFREAYSGLRGYDVDSFYTSLDGMTFRPPLSPFHTETSSDWPHLDQTTKVDDAFRCIQGQVVLTNSSAAFRASPRSHLLMKDFLKHAGKTNAPGDWARFSKKHAAYMREKLSRVGGEYQVPIHAPRGSMILWLSSVVHSAQVQAQGAPRDKSDPFSEWRCVVYVCFRPKAETGYGHAQLLQRCYERNLVTNHWGTEAFLPSFSAGCVNSTLLPYLRSPQKAYEIDGLRPPDTPAVRALLYADEDESTVADKLDEEATDPMAEAVANEST